MQALWFAACSGEAHECCLAHRRGRLGPPVLNDPGDEQAREQDARAPGLLARLLENDFNLVASLAGEVFLNERLAQLQPDTVIVDANSDVRDAPEHVVMATRDTPRPIVMLTNDSETAHILDAVAAGVTICIAAGLASERIRPIPYVATLRRTLRAGSAGANCNGGQ